MDKKVGIFANISPKTASRLTKYCTKNKLQKKDVIEFALKRLFRDVPKLEMTLK